MVRHMRLDHSIVALEVNEAKLDEDLPFPDGGSMVKWLIEHTEEQDKSVHTSDHL